MTAKSRTPPRKALPPREPRSSRTPHDLSPASRGEPPQRAQEHRSPEHGAENCRAGLAPPSRDIALTYLRLANLDNELIDRLSRYEATLWRQAVQTLFTLQTLKRR
jgi:hypothetical protein